MIHNLPSENAQTRVTSAYFLIIPTGMSWVVHCANRKFRVINYLVEIHSILDHFQLPFFPSHTLNNSLSFAYHPEKTLSRPAALVLSLFLSPCSFHPVSNIKHDFMN